MAAKLWREPSVTERLDSSEFEKYGSIKAIDLILDMNPILPVAETYRLDRPGTREYSHDPFYCVGHCDSRRNISQSAGDL
jgi:hypothetical protein